MRVVLDSNVLISAFATKGLCADIFRDTLNSHELLVSDHILNEVSGKLLQKLRIPEATVDSIRHLLSSFVVTPSSLPEIGVPIRDPEDVPVVSFAVAVSAGVLVTGDRDLLDIAARLPVKVVSPRGFYTRQQA